MNNYKEKIDMCFHHLDYLLKIKCEKVSVLEMRSHIAWYLKGIPGSVEVKNMCFKATKIEELRDILKKYLNKSLIVYNLQFVHQHILFFVIHFLYPYSFINY